MVGRPTKRFKATLAALLVAAASVLPARSGAAQPDAAQSAPASNAQLDEMLAAHQWGALGAALRPDPQSISRMMDWLHQRIDTGGGVLLPIIFARDLWMVGQGLNVADPMQDMRATASMMNLYAYALIMVDGKVCEDHTAPAHRLDQLFQARASTLGFLRALPVDTKTKIVEIAMALERKTAPLRGDDDLVCRDGLAQMKAGLTEGRQTEAASAPGTVGRTVLVDPPVNWKPSEVPATVYRPLQDQARQELRGDMIKLVAAVPTAL